MQHLLGLNVLKVDMIGAVPTHWGGGVKWRGGGVASHVQGLISVLPSNGVQVRLLADNTDAAQGPPFPELAPEVRFQAMARAPRNVLRLGVRRLVRLAWRMILRPELRTSAPPAQVVRFWAQAVNYDHFLSGSSADIVHVHRAFNRQFLCQRAVGVNVPMVVTMHSVNPLVQLSPEWVGQMFRQNYSRAEHIIAVSNFVKKKIVEYGADPDNIAVITNGVDVNLFRPRPHREARDKLGLPPESFIVLFSGNLIPRKGVDVLIQAFSRCVERYPDARLVVVGVGDEEERLTDLVAELGVTSQVIFTGYRPFTEMPLWYQACDVFVMPSWAEGLSMAILEAMASGRPVITSRPEVGEHDAVIQGETGLLVEYGNVEKLALILDRLMSSPQMVRRLGHGARKMAMATFTWDLIGRRTAEVYRVAMRQARQG